MTTENSLVIKVDSTDTARAAKSLDELAAAGGRAEKSATALTQASAVLAGAATKAASAHDGWMRNMAGVDRAVRATTSATIELSKETQRIIDRYDPLGTKLRSLQSDFALLRREMGNSGSEAAIKSFQGLEDEIDATRKLMEQAGVAAEGQGKATQGLGLNTQYARRELMMLGKEALTGDFSRMPRTFGSLVTHSNLLQAAMSPLGLAIAGVTTALVAGAVAWNHYENIVVESADATLNAIEAEYAAREALESMTETSINHKIKLLDRELVAQRAYADDVSHKTTRFNWRSSAEELAKFNKEIEKNLLLRGQLVAQQPVAESESELSANLARNKTLYDDARREEEAAAKKIRDAIAKYNSEMSAKLAGIEKDRLYAAIAEDKAGRIAHSQFLLTMELGRIKDTAQSEKEANQDAANAAIREYLRRGEASAEANEAYVAQQKEADKAQKAIWESIDKTAHDTFVSVANGNKDMWSRMKESGKNIFFDWLYSMTAKKWLISISAGFTGAGASGAASATGMGGGGGIGGLINAGQTLWSGFSGGMASSMGSLAMSAGEIFGSAALTEFGVGATYAGAGGTIAGAAAGSTAAGIGATVATAMPYIAAAMAAYSIGKAIFGSKGTPTSSLGNAAAQFDPTGAMTGQQTYFGGSSAGVDAQIASMQTGYMKAAMALGIGTVATQFSFGANTGRNAQNPQFALGGGAGGVQFYQGESPTSEAAVQLAASRAVFAALQGSELPGFLAKMFDGLVVGSMTQQDIDNTLAFAGAVKQMREALLETRPPLEVLRANVNAATLALATSAATFRTDFVAAIDAGINPQAFEQWKALGNAIDQLAEADAQLAADNLARFTESLKKLQDVAISNFEAARKATDGLRAFAMSVRELQQSLWAGSQTPLSSTYDVTRSQFAAINAAAGANDTNAQGNLASAATAFLDASKLRSGSAIEYARDFAFVQNSLDSTATLTENAVSVADLQLEELKKSNAWLSALDEKSGSQTQSLEYLLSAAVASSEASRGAVVEQAISSLTNEIAAAVGSTYSQANLSRTVGAAGETALSYAGAFKTVGGSVSATGESSGISTSVSAAQQTALTEKNRIDSLNAQRVSAQAEIDRAKSMAAPSTYINGQTSDAAWELVLSRFNAAHQAQFGIPMNRTWGADTDAARAYSSLVDQYRAVTIAQAQSVYDAIPAFATGTNEVPFDMTARIHAGEEIKPRAYVEQDKTDKKETNDLLRKLVAANDEMKKELTAIKKTNYQMAVIEARREEIGMPEVREAA